jgi:hypothetical protein
MSVEVEDAAKDAVVRTSRVVLSIVLPSIFLAFCVLAYFAKPMVPDTPQRKKADRLDIITTGTIGPALAKMPLPAHHHLVSGYGIDG